MREETRAIAFHCRANRPTGSDGRIATIHRSASLLRLHLVEIAEIPAECGLVEAGVATADEWKGLIRRQAGFFSFDPDTRRYCMITVPAPWRDTPGPTWQLVAAMLRNQRRELEEKPPAPPAQQRLTFACSSPA